MDNSAQALECIWRNSSRLNIPVFRRFVFSQKAFNVNPLQSTKNIARILLGLLFIAASSLHFISDAELQIIPPFLPWRRTALYITGIAELIGGVGLLIPRFKRLAAWGLVALLIAIFPANIYHAV